MLFLSFRFTGTLLGLLGEMLTLPLLLQAQLLHSFAEPLPEEHGEQFSCMAEIQGKLKKEEALLDYCLKDSLLFIFAVSQDGFLLVKKEIGSGLRKSIREFRKKLSSADIRDLTSLGRSMYLDLVSPVKEFIAGKNRLIVIPGKELGEVPFEAFVSDGATCPSCRQGQIHYLVYDFEIIYHYTAMLWAEPVLGPDGGDDGLENKPEYSFSGFSPVFMNHPSLAPLPGSRQEVTAIGSMFRQMGLTSCVLFDQDSREARFREVACRSKILHLATHSYRPQRSQVADGVLFWGYDQSGSNDSPQDGVLTGNEINDLKLHADLIVLNACCTASGLAGGKCCNSPLPLNFLLAGARNILSSLWNVTDLLAGRFMVGFYRNWFEGLTYSAALRNIKLEMIRNPETALPTVWAPYVLVGQ